MKTVIRNIGNSKGVLLPKPLLAMAGLDEAGAVEMRVESGTIVLSKPAKAVRAGWAQAAAALGQSESDDLLLGDFPNADDSELVW